MVNAVVQHLQSGREFKELTPHPPTHPDPRAPAQDAFATAPVHQAPRPQPADESRIRERCPDVLVTTPPQSKMVEVVTGGRGKGEEKLFSHA